MRQLPGEDIAEIPINEAQIKELFSHTVQSSTGTSKLAEGLRSWVKFGMVRTVGKVNSKMEQFNQGDEVVEQTKGLKRPSSQDQKAYTMANTKHRQLYGAWYLDPQVWNKRYKHQVKIQEGDQPEDTRQSTLSASLPGQVDMLGSSQPVSQLHSTKAFRKFLEKKSDYTQPTFIKYIFKSDI